MKTLGFDLGSSFIKGVIVDSETGRELATAMFPDNEMEMKAVQAGWAEQSPELWWQGITELTFRLTREAGKDIGAIGISYQMHGLVLVNKEFEPVRPSIIWCDSRAAPIGQEAFRSLGKDHCLSHYLNSPGNFTASKMKWVLENEPATLRTVRHAMLPGDFIALKLTGEASTTVSGLSEMILWDFDGNHPALDLLSHYGLDNSLLPEIVDTFTDSLRLSNSAADILGLDPGIPVSYRAGDQANNALSLSVFEPGDISTTAGTSGVVYGITDQKKYDEHSRVNTFVHVNHDTETPRHGVLMCVNGTGIMNRWAKEAFGWSSYNDMNLAASAIPVGSEGLRVFPFGNGAERILRDEYPGASIEGIELNIHRREHIARAVQEGIVYALNYGLEIMKTVGIEPRQIKAGAANMFQSPLFAGLMADLSGVPIVLYDTNGAKGAALAAAYGAGAFNSLEETFSHLKVLKKIEPKRDEELTEHFVNWRDELEDRVERSI